VPPGSFAQRLCYMPTRFAVDRVKMQVLLEDVIVRSGRFFDRLGAVRRLLFANVIHFVRDGTLFSFIVVLELSVGGDD